ncbi:Glycosyltransferase AglI [uncultured archaeon]|nr:Glycosyltransferase AglI [uncultured archaeon]
MQKWRISLLIIAAIVFYASIFVIPFSMFFLLTNFLMIFFSVLVILMFFEKKENPQINPDYKPLVSIIMPCYNDGKYSVEAIGELLKATYKKIEIIVINDGSTDDSLQLLKQIKNKRVKVLNNQINLGKAASLNKGIKQSKGELILVIDGDTIVEKTAIENAVKLISNEKIGAVVGIVRVKNNDKILEKIQEVEYLVNFGFWSKALGNKDSIFITPGPFALYKKKILRQVNYFDKNNITEDMDVGIKIRKLGYNIIRSEKSIVYTYIPNKLNNLFRQRTRWSRGKIFNIFKHREILFKKKYGFLGKIMMPLSFIVEFMGVAILVRAIYLFLNYLLTSINTTITLFKVDSSMVLSKALELSIVDSSTYFIFSFLLLMVIMIYFSIKIGSYKVTLKNFWSILLYGTLIGIFLPVAYLNAIRLEGFNKKLKW